MDDFEIANKSNFELGFTSAFKIIDDEALLEKKIPHAGCNSIVLLFTDGGAVYPENAVKEWNWNKGVGIQNLKKFKQFTFTFFSTLLLDFFYY